MAVSPLPQSPATSSIADAAKVKGLAVRNLAQGAAESPAAASEVSGGADPITAGDIAEQLNEEVRRKYVKGERLVCRSRTRLG